MDAHSAGRAGKREDEMLETIHELVTRRDRCLRWIRRIAHDVPVTETLMRDLELVLTTPAPEMEIAEVQLVEETPC